MGVVVCRMTSCCFLVHVTVLLLVLCVVAAAAVEVGRLGLEEQESDLVTNLPGQPAVGFRHYAGYIKIRPGVDEKALFYWFFEAESQVGERPLVLWLNGGPGCSSVAYGAAQELGPFLFHNYSHTVLNEFSWNKVANLLFVESPIGVGFSYSNKSEDLQNLGDRVTAEDSYAFLLQWFKRFPNFKSHDFYITGESYAGHYVPQLAEQIFYGNQRATNDSYINFKGFLIGNAVLNDGTDDRGLVDYAWSHGIVSDRIYNNVIRSCKFTADNETNECNAAFNHLFHSYSGIDIYNIYAPVCTNSDGTQYLRKFIAPPRMLSKNDWWHKLPSGYDPCTESYVQTYFNREDVQQALHANVTKLPYPYRPCSNSIDYKESATTVLPIIERLLKAGIRIWIYSGDVDARVPITSTRYSVNAMKMKVELEWRAWYYKRQVAGWVETYETGLTLATVRGAGHQVPVFKPHQSLSLFSHFLKGATLPSSPYD